MAVDVERCDGPGGAELTAARRQMSALIADMCDFQAFDELPLCRQSAGDSEVVLLPVGIDEPRTVTVVMNWLVYALHQVNAAGGGPKVRLRVAVHEGITMLVAGVFDGPAVRKARWLLSASPLRAVLADQPGATMAVLFSDRIHADLGGFDGCLPPGEFTAVELDDLSAQAPEIGWLLVPKVIT